MTEEKSRKIWGSKKADQPRKDFADKEEIQAWLKEAVSKIVKIPPARIDSHRSFPEYGLDSLALVELSGNLGEFLNRDLPQLIAWEYPTIELLSAYLAEENSLIRAEETE